ncbi:hypothetical protein [Paenibacillus flagellatus]|uniref:Uncharacterized protein n=1 Tax=Paenibacillus flagellatus TaxID=2211139 RepID=A0A2V5KTN2_9BACL|nr:hypothetical protein [Paenibacillus flagellatus]PYI55137.1 hypothetical protein DLM86_11470 [Paenibacillus flagellatus]
MIRILLVLAVAGAAAAFELPAMWRKRWRKEAAAYALLLAAGIAISIAAVLEADVPSPLLFMQMVFKPIHDLFLNRGWSP